MTEQAPLLLLTVARLDLSLLKRLTLDIRTVRTTAIHPCLPCTIGRAGDTQSQLLSPVKAVALRLQAAMAGPLVLECSSTTSQCTWTEHPARQVLGLLSPPARKMMELLAPMSEGTKAAVNQASISLLRGLQLMCCTSKALEAVVVNSSGTAKQPGRNMATFWVTSATQSPSSLSATKFSWQRSKMGKLLMIESVVYIPQVVG